MIESVLKIQRSIIFTKKSNLMRIITTTSILFILFCMINCTEINNEQCSTPAPLNPNGDSELALLMREMYEDGMRMKSQIEKGEQPKIIKKFEAIHTAKATEPEKAASEKYKVFANSYLATMDALQNASPDEANVLYKGMVESCMNCHRSMCPGPIVRIKNLSL